MNYKRILLATTFVAVLVTGAAAQLGTGGEVVDVVDGKTVIVAVPSGRFTVELQYIDVPETAQALHGVVKDHLRKLVLGKSVELRTKGFTPGKATARMMLSGVDVSQQMLRDGAAWHVAIELSGQRRDEFDTYAESEALARKEKRGVWSVAGLEPAWQFRAKAKQVVMNQPVRSTSVDSKTVATRKGYWTDKNPWLKDPGILINGYNAASKLGYIGTPLLGVTDEHLKPFEKLAVAITFHYTEKGQKGRDGHFLIRILSSGGEGRFGKVTPSVHVDGKNYPMKRERREVKEDVYGGSERVTYRVEKATIDKMANGAQVYIAFGNYHLTPKNIFLQMLLYNMLTHAS